MSTVVIRSKISRLYSLNIAAVLEDFIYLFLIFLCLHNIYIKMLCMDQSYIPLILQV